MDSTAYSDLGPTLPSTYSEPPMRKSPDPRLVKIISELGLRFRPLATADQEAHAAQVALLVQDLEGTDTALLAEAAREWIRTEKWMPKAADLLELIAKARAKPNPNSPENLQRLADKYNADPQFSSNVRWLVRGTELICEHR
jgi:hypothetical protein